jgi:hypothetical protein
MRFSGSASLCYLHGYFSWSASPRMRDRKGVDMTTKVCTNSECPAYAHFVYTVAMRCVLCRCDLMAAHRNAEATGFGLGGTQPSLAPVTPRKPLRAHAAR